MNLTENAKKITVSISIAIIVLGSYFLLFNPTSKNHTSKILLASCYYQKIGSTDSLMQINSQESGKISGELVIHNAEKDSSYGTFVGKIKNETLNIDFKFLSEGIESVRQITYKITGNSLVGEGFTYQSINDCRSIEYPQGLGLIPYRVNLPLDLFSNIGVSYQDQQELLKRIGSKDLLPIENIALEYRPTQGEPLNLAYIYYWNAEVWQKVQTPNSPPDWGVVLKNENGKVLTINTIQDCVYEKKLDCENVTEIYSALIDKTSWINTN